MMFKLTNISTIFQILINKVLRNLIDYLCIIYLNNILIYFKTQEKY